MTLLSVVLPIYKVQGYLRQCLDSLLDQSFTDIEIVAVDDRSPDHSGEILAEYADRDPRVRVLSLAQNVGLGHARNAGLAQATGEYVWFVDSDDWLAAGALAAAADRLRATDADVLVVGYDRVHWDGEVVTRDVNQALAQAPETFTLESWPPILNILHVAWNKIVRRDLLVKLGFQFEQGWYEDVSFTYPVLVAAERVSTLPITCVHYRQRRTGAITRTVGDRHFEIFDHWAHALALVDQYSDRAEALRPLLFRRMIWHFLVVLRSPDRVPRKSRRRFFKRMNEEYHRYLPPGGYPGFEGTQGLRQRFVRRGNYPALRALELAADVVHAGRKLRAGVRRRARTAAGTLRRSVYHLYYLVQLRRPVDPKLALFAAYWFRGVSCNPAAIAAKTKELAPDVRTVWVVNRNRVAGLPPGTDYVVTNTLAYYRAVARARWLINNVNWPNRVVKRPGTTHVMTHHGTPLKMMGLDQLDHPAGGGNTDIVAQMRRADRWDFSVSANAHTTIAWDRAYPCRYETLEVGYPRNDRLAVATPTDTTAVRAKLGIRPGQRVVLYLPTHREWQPAGRPVLDVDELARRLGPDAMLLVRAHYFHVPPSAVHDPEPRGSIVDVSAYPVVEDLYLAADVMITDYSSAMFDYAVLDRPIVIHAPDWPTYQELRGVYFDLMAQPPGAVATSDAELFEIFASGAWAGAEAAAARAAFRARFCYLDDGGAAERVVRRVLLDESAP
ncbi:MAG TPA: CDP-glycerol glycerophosphotransferase family protein [Actinoplanes sp.]|jgi:CDP-glycerol glycerophosphotransferase|nr:CDP-glycerol glycerophosphotransferase family protein [Actinoplanes sp.]